MSNDLSDDQRSVVERVQKLLALAGKNPSEAEASSAMAKAMALLAQHNLDMGIVERESGGGGKRAQESLFGGFYQWQQDLWRAVAQLNFCVYWRGRKWDEVEYNRTRWDGTKSREKRWRKTYTQNVVGRRVNIAATQAMAGYLVGVCQRLTRERLGGDNTQMLSGWATSFREGIVQRVVEKLEEKRRQVLDEEKARELAAQKMAMGGASSSTGMTLGTLTKQEQDANNDFIMGEGWSAKKAAERATRAMWRRMADEDRTAWAVDHPEEAAAQAAQDRASRRSRYSSGPRERDKDWGAFRAGYEAAENISIDQQAEQRKTAGSLGHG